jgi:hypothetical protein
MLCTSFTQAIVFTCAKFGRFVGLEAEKARLPTGLLINYFICFRLINPTASPPLGPIRSRHPRRWHRRKLQLPFKYNSSMFSKAG